MDLEDWSKCIQINGNHLKIGIDHYKRGVLGHILQAGKINEKFYFKNLRRLGKSLVGCSPWCHEELDTTEWLPFHFSLLCFGEGNGQPFQSSCLESPRDGWAWWASVYGVAQSRAQLKWLSSSSLSLWGSGVGRRGMVVVVLKLKLTKWRES